MTQVKTLSVDLKERSYPIWIGPGLLANLAHYLKELNIETNRKLLIITDEKVAAFHLTKVLNHLKEQGYTVYSYTVAAGEQSKSLAVFEKIITYALEMRLNRKSVILALGGGVVGDLAGFVASTYMRGIPFIQLPTTLLAHDSSVGGKVAINHPLGKNMIGAFYQPLAVIYDTQVLSTLPPQEIASGFAEVLKHAFIWDASFVDWLKTHAKACLSLEEPYLSEALYRAISIKSEVVSRDEREEHLRAILNFGHTFAHAFEALGNYETLRHGEAVAIGMALASVVSEEVYKVKLAEPIISLLKQYNLPVDWHQLPWSFEQVLEKMYGDKKVYGEKLRLVLLKQLGQAVITDQVPEETLRACWQYEVN